MNPNDFEITTHHPIATGSEKVFIKCPICKKEDLLLKEEIKEKMIKCHNCKYERYVTKEWEKELRKKKRIFEMI